MKTKKRNSLFFLICLMLMMAFMAVFGFNAVSSCEDIDVPATMGLYPDTISIDDDNLIATTTIVGTARGTITLNTEGLPNEIILVSNAGVITITGIRPTANVAAIKGEFVAVVARGGFEVDLTINVNLTSTYVMSGNDCNDCEKDPCECNELCPDCDDYICECMPYYHVPIAIVLVIDVSSSMFVQSGVYSFRRWQLARYLAVKALDELTIWDYVGVISFCYEARIEIPLTSTRYKDKIEDAIMNVDYSYFDETVFGKAIQTAGQMLYEHYAEARHIVLFSDGVWLGDGFGEYINRQEAITYFYEFGIGLSAVIFSGDHHRNFIYEMVYLGGGMHITPLTSEVMNEIFPSWIIYLAERLRAPVYS